MSFSVWANYTQKTSVQIFFFFSSYLNNKKLLNKSSILLNNLDKSISFILMYGLKEFCGLIVIFISILLDEKMQMFTAF